MTNENIVVYLIYQTNKNTEKMTLLKQYLNTYQADYKVTNGGLVLENVSWRLGGFDTVKENMELLGLTVVKLTEDRVLVTK